MQQIANVFKIKDLKRRIIFVLVALAVYRLGALIPIPGINTAADLDRFIKLIRIHRAEIAVKLVA